MKEITDFWIYLKYNSLRYSEESLRKSKQQRNVQFFDDLLALVHQALAEPQGNRLAARIRLRYRAALVDEFQDTDQIQYEIFSRIFSESACPLFMIGDPKQAIYSFRGADVFSYFKAASQAVNRYTLTENFRSSPGLIQAVNTLFQNVNRPFIFKAIPFIEGTAGKPADPGSNLGAGGLHIWHLAFEQDQHATVKEIGTRIADAMCAEIISLATDNENIVQLGDIAILVRTNRQAVVVKSILSNANIPAVIYSAGNVMATPEADEIGRILTSIANPSRVGALKSALTTDVMGWHLKDIDPNVMKIDWWENTITNFMDYQRSWKQDGFIAMFRRFMAAEKVRVRLLSQPNGDRRLTNLMHIAEILHAATTEKNLGMTGLLKWFFRQTDPDVPKQEIHQLRLESDDQAVKVITIHKSKGLEFPVVFCPFSWGGTQVAAEDFTFHDLQADGRITLDLGSKAREVHWVLARNEQLAENLRLLYVAVTRAAHQCYLVWPRTRSAGSSALAYLIHGRRVADDLVQYDDVAARLQKKFNNLSADDFLADLQHIKKGSGGSIMLSPLPEKRVAMHSPEPTNRDRLQVRRFKGQIDKSWRIASYSSLVSHSKREHELPDRDELTDPAELNRESGLGEDAAIGTDQAAQGLFAFPKGLTSGIFFHDILENLDFSNPDKRVWQDLVRIKLPGYGFDPKWEIPILDMLDNLSKVILSPRMAPFTLAAVDNSNRINEMPFYYPLKRVSAKTLARVFGAHSNQTTIRDFPQVLERLTFSPVAGLMKGFMDVLFLHNDRYYIVDWKSNFLGMAWEKYRSAHLNAEMRNSFYILQYHLYVLATHLHLQMRLPGYAYAKNFGGIFYIFLRGISAQLGPEYGIYEDRPDFGLIRALENALIPA